MTRAGRGLTVRDSTVGISSILEPGGVSPFHCFDEMHLIAGAVGGTEEKTGALTSNTQQVLPYGF